MAEDADNLVLALLRSIRGDVAILSDDMSDIKGRITNLELNFGQMRADEQIHYAGIMSRCDRLEQRLDRIERRLDLVEG